MVNGLGGAIYATRLLERAFHGVTNIQGVSHQFMHIVVIIGALLYRDGLLLVYANRYASRSLY
jgi:predicted membrane channel-forming protein YqfA (hemolysin III family)